MADVVEHRGDGENLRIVRGAFELRDCRGEQPRSHGVVEEIRLAVLARVFDGTSNDRGVGHDDTGEQTRCIRHFDLLCAAQSKYQHPRPVPQKLLEQFGPRWDGLDASRAAVAFN